MTKQEQIEEMAKVIDKTIRNECVLKTGGCTDCNFLGIDTDEYECQSLLISTMLYNTGYGKVSEYEAEIERLNNEYNKAFERLKSQQQEINTLKEENERLYIFKRKLEDELIEHGWAEYVDDKIITLSTATEEARKETAKEIISFIESKDKKCGKYSIYTKLLQELKEKYLEVEE